MKARILFPSLSLAASLMVVAAGCNRESPKGGPAAADKTKNGSFTIKVPSGHTNVTQGGQTEVSVSINRNGTFDQDVKLTFQPTEGLQVTPESVTAKKGADEAKVTVKAADTAPPGTTNVKVTGTPTTGTATTVDMGIEIKKK